MRIGIKRSVAKAICRRWGLPIVLKSVRDPKLEYFKRKILEHLDKLERKEKAQMRKSLAYLERLEKAQKRNVGEVVTWGRKVKHEYIKGADGKWRRYYRGTSRGQKLSIAALKRKVDACKDVGELWDLVFANWGRFMDADKMPLPVVRELHAYASKREDEITAGVVNKPRSERKGKQKKEEVKGKKPIQNMKASAAVLARKKQKKEKAEQFQNFLNYARWRYDQQHIVHERLAETAIDLVNTRKVNKADLFEKVGYLRSVQLKMLLHWKTIHIQLEKARDYKAKNRPGLSKNATNAAIEAAGVLYGDFDIKSGKEFKEKYLILENKINDICSKVQDIKVDDEFWKKDMWEAAYNRTNKMADAMLRKKTGDLWTTLTNEERDAVYAYTKGSGEFNRPLSGFDSDWDMSSFKGVGNVNFNNESPNGAKYIRDLTRVIERSSYDYDVVLRRGEDPQEIENHLNLPIGSLAAMDDDKLSKLTGKEFVNNAFTSTGVAENVGFYGQVRMQILAPKGTKMIYTEPFSYYGEGSERNWDGVSQQDYFSREQEAVIQRDTRFRIKNIYKEHGIIYMRLEIVEQRNFS